jgi:hypothetical protein
MGMGVSGNASMLYRDKAPRYGSVVTWLVHLATSYRMSRVPLHCIVRLAFLICHRYPAREYAWVANTSAWTLATVPKKAMPRGNDLSYLHLGRLSALTVGFASRSRGSRNCPIQACRILIASSLSSFQQTDLATRRPCDHAAFRKATVLLSTAEVPVPP